MSQSQIDLETFRNFEKAAHDKLAESYHDAFSAVTDRAIEPLLKATCVENETRLLDVATGPGTLAAKAAERGARVGSERPRGSSLVGRFWQESNKWNLF